MSANGKLPDDELVYVQGKIRLAKSAAPLWFGVVRAGRSEVGVTARISEPYGGYRDTADQTAMNRNKSSSSTGVVAPVGRSVHGKGRSVDVFNWPDFGVARDSKGREYSPRLDAIMLRFGAKRTYASSLWEPWHYEFNWPVLAGEILTESEDDMAPQIFENKFTKEGDGDFFWDDVLGFREVCPLTNLDGTPHPQHMSLDGQPRERMDRGSIAALFDTLGYRAPIRVDGSYIVLLHKVVTTRVAAFKAPPKG